MDALLTLCLNPIESDPGIGFKVHCDAANHVLDEHRMVVSLHRDVTLVGALRLGRQGMIPLALPSR